MSHFPVLIIGENPEQQLAPFQENNMGDCPKQYLTFSDQTDEYLAEYEKDVTTMVKMPDGSLLSPYDKRFKVKKKAFDYEYEHPKDLEHVTIPFTELYLTFGEFMQDWAGCELDPETGKYGYWDNKNKRWDWYVLGGRWNGYFLLKNGFSVDRALNEQIDWQGMTQRKLAIAERDWAEFERELNAYNFNPECVQNLAFTHGIESKKIGESIVLETKEEHLLRRSSVATFAVLQDGKWYERGKMGWWACVSDEKDNQDWNAEFISLVESVSGSTLMSLYDCHI